MTDEIDIPARELCADHIGWLYEGRLITSIFIYEKNDISINTWSRGNNRKASEFEGCDLITLRKPEADNAM